MHIVIIGVGGVGGYYGGRIAQSGQKVSMLCRGKHLEAIEQKGLQIKSLHGDFVVKPHLVTDKVTVIEKADLILICTKSWQVTEAARLLQPLLKENTVVIPLQNGADNAPQLLTVLDKKHVMGGLCKIYSRIEAPGTITHFGHDPELLFGELDGKKSERATKIKAILDNALFRTTIPEDIQVAIWTKFMFIATVSGLGGLTRASLGKMYKNSGTRTILEQTATEIYKIAKAKQINLPADAVAQCMHFISKQPYNSTASTQRDIMEGRPSELENFNGYLIREGEKLGIPTPTNRFIYECLLPMEEHARNNMHV